MAIVSDQLRFTKEPYVEDVGPRKIKSIQFASFSGSEISKAAEVQVWRGSYYDSSKLPIESGLLDPRMGPANKNGTCATCHGSFSTCPGHFGYLKLVLPVFNLGYFSAILNIMKCICKSCARILLTDKDRRDNLRKMRNPKMEVAQKITLVKIVIKKCKPTTCKQCGFVNGVVKKGGSVMTILHDRPKHKGGTLEECGSAISHTKDSRAPFQVVDVLNPARVLALFKRMLDEDCELLYLFDRPEKFILTDIAVPPIAIRPSVFMDGGRDSNEDDITTRLKFILQANASLREDLNCTSSTSKRLADWELLQTEVAQYINSDVRGVPSHMQPARPLRGFIQRLKGKQGRFRGNLSGKRVEYTGRTVISPDPNLKITEVAIPILIAQRLTYPERVSNHNLEKLRQCVRNGPQKYPGANIVRCPDGTMTHLRYSARKRVADELKYGYIVERHLEDGDVVLFNRQPSLHRMSIMSHRAKVLPWRTLRFNESVCNPYNADFDGDEMNMHVPQTEEARTEALMLMGVQNNLCTPKNGEILVASTQDFLTSSFLITRKDTFYDRAAFTLMCSYMGDGMDSVDLPTPSLIKPIELWTGKQLFSILIRPHANMRVYLNLTVEEKSYCKKGETMCPYDGFVYFRNSELVCGQLGKATLGNGNKNGLFSVLLRDYNAHGAAACMNRLAKLSARWIGNHGFSIGVDDVQPGILLERRKAEEIEEGFKTCEELIQQFHEGKIEAQPGCDKDQELEASISRVLNDIRDKAAKVCTQELHWRNSPLIMYQCGSKGNNANICQMVACVGQQSVGGSRAPDGFIDRSLPHFTRKSKLPAAKGFVANSFFTGLTATEFFFHTMGGREGLVDTAVKTADTGYMSRRLVKALEDLSIQYDNTVRNASGAVVQFVYGDDGMDPSQTEGTSGGLLNLERLYLKVKATCPIRGNATLSPSELSKFVAERLLRYDITPKGNFSKDFEKNLIEFLVIHGSMSSSEVHKFVAEKLSEKCGTTEKGCSDAFKKSLLDFFDIQISTLTRTRRSLKLDGDWTENSSSVLEKLSANISGITPLQLKVFLETCISRYNLKRIEAGTAIGVIGAQSIGEPGTQMTLKTFHFAGLASMNVTAGVPRIKEIINGTKNISTPIITAILEHDNDINFANRVSAIIQRTVLEQVARSIVLVSTMRRTSIVVKLDMERTSRLKITANTVKQSILNHPRIKLKPQDIDILDDDKLEIKSPEGDRSKLQFELMTLKSVLPKVIVKGIPTIERVIINADKKKGKYNLLAEGTNLLAVMGTPGVDGNKTKSNHIIEVQNTLGIESARNVIIAEIQGTMESHGMKIDIRHMMLLGDLMTSKGEVLGITRFGIEKMKDSVLMLASFEKTSDHLFNASVNGRDDKIEGVSECIIMGIPMQLGTGILKVRQRVENYPTLNYGIDPIIS